MSQQAIIIGLSNKYNELIERHNILICEHIAEKKTLNNLLNHQFSELIRVTDELNDLKNKYEELKLMHHSAVILSKMRK